MTEKEKAAFIAENVLEWCEPIGMHRNQLLYQEAGREIAEAIRNRMDEVVALTEAATSEDSPVPDTKP